MRLARYLTAGGSTELGILDANAQELCVILGATDLLPLLHAGSAALASAAAVARRHGRRRSVSEVSYLSPIATPPSVRDFYSFEQHVKAGRSWRGLEMDPDWYQLPVFYFSNPYALTGCGEVTISPGANQFDFELEVAAIVGARGRDVSPIEAEGLIAGYCVLNDWSARDLQQREMKMSLGPVKGKDSATGLGPWFVTPDEIADAKEGAGFALQMTCEVNGTRYAGALWSDVYWSFGEMISYASRGTEVRPGDVIGSGTCGTGCILELRRRAGSDVPSWLQPGDEVVASIERLGELRNVVVAGRSPHPLRDGLA
jgi:2-keto-4-pentenoate hydratase/2-oxohepta-3-ene-1,7-dioic acid hydratase in catechol pathway